MTVPELQAARKEADAAREQLEESFGDVRSELLPAAIVPVTKALGLLARKAVRKSASKVTTGSVNAARDRPVLAIGIALASALFVFRKPLIDAIARRSKTGEKK